MNERLRLLIEEFIVAAGENAVTKLSAASGVAPRVIYQVKNEGHVPRPVTIRKLAKACGLSDEAALAMARESAGLGVPA